MPGEPDTLVVGGSTATDAGHEVAAAAFNQLDGALAALQIDRARDPGRGPGRRGRRRRRQRRRGRAHRGTLRDFRRRPGGSDDLSIGMARVLVDAEKRCDLALAIVGAGRAGPARRPRRRSVTLRVTNNGQRALRGAVSLPGAVRHGRGAAVTGKLGPGQSYHAHRRRSATARRSRPTTRWR